MFSSEKTYLRKSREKIPCTGLTTHYMVVVVEFTTATGIVFKSN
jgi:hypothetical protein